LLRSITQFRNRTPDLSNGQWYITSVLPLPRLISRCRSVAKFKRGETRSRHGREKPRTKCETHERKGDGFYSYSLHLNLL
jgi:hypothetical protein